MEKKIFKCERCNIEEYDIVDHYFTKKCKRCEMPMKIVEGDLQTTLR